MDGWPYVGRLTEDCIECVVGETAELFGERVSPIWGSSKLHSQRYHTMVKAGYRINAEKSIE